MSIVTDYAAAVRAALADIPQADRDELLEDLEEHLAEVAAEHDGPLEDRLGTPEAYAAELRAAYTEPVSTKTRRGPRELVSGLERGTQRLFDGVLPEGSAGRDLARDLRPLWWVARGYLAGYLVNALLLNDGTDLWPNGRLALLVLVMAIAGSVLLGGRGRRRPRRGSVILLAVAGLTGLAVLGALAFSVSVRDGYAEAVPSASEPGSQLGAVANIYVFTRDGKPVKDVLLYDEWGQPIVTTPDAWGYIERGGDPLTPNVYPKQICAESGMESTLVPLCPDNAQVGPFPDEAGPTFPAVAPTASPAATPPPSDNPSADPTDSPSPTPSD
ncbi:HAAS signaling domain-containing protein [Actinocorallia sp. A-T 12471]|uniref:HAAS signaling domain-containing protein n=1 Tax=Actinocorallia sp. A-T 12471 TaxID=3089813 RepID=UPI0029D08140|nr:hypothetical protein [Actinocorallia sp. A-T 12471]MDX6738938.1 hypothetical protein [Actinocorallia sp. A-T 12471]